MATQLNEVKRTPEEAEQLLHALVGRWEGEMQVWFQPGQEPVISPARGEARQVQGSRFVILEYQTGEGQETAHGVVLYGYNIFSQQFEMAWGESFHMPTNIMFASGPGLEHGFSVLGSYLYEVDKPAWGWRTQIDVLDADHLTITAYNVLPEGDEYKGVETVYRRV